MILSSLPSTLQTSCPRISSHTRISDVSSTELATSPLYPRIRNQKLGFSTSKQVDVRQQGSCRLSHLQLFKCRASGEVEVDSASFEGTSKSNSRANLAMGSPIVVVEAPPMLKSAEPMPMMRRNMGLIKAGDAGRIIDRRPKDVWAVRFAVGAYLIDGKYFEPLIEE